MLIEIGYNAPSFVTLLFGLDIRHYLFLHFISCVRRPTGQQGTSIIRDLYTIGAYAMEISVQVGIVPSSLDLHVALWYTFAGYEDSVFVGLHPLTLLPAEPQ
jgi:hypothetical protein